MMYFPKTASTALSIDSLVTLSSGQLVAATSSSTKVLGVLRRASVSTDSDYTSTTMLPVEVPLDNTVVWEALTASAVAGDVGANVDLTDALTVNRGGTSHKVVLISGFISATLVEVVLSSTYFDFNGS